MKITKEAQCSPSHQRRRKWGGVRRRLVSYPLSGRGMAKPLDRTFAVRMSAATSCSASKGADRDVNLHFPPSLSSVPNRGAVFWHTCK